MRHEEILSESLHWFRNTTAREEHATVIRFLSVQTGTTRSGARRMSWPIRVAVFGPLTRDHDCAARLELERTRGMSANLVGGSL